jgi:ferric-dicitrate binding protein FerR (iron transport regulator)
MKSDPPFARFAARALAGAETGDEPVSDETADRIKLAMREALQRKAQRRRTRRIGAAAAIAVAAAAILGIGIHRWTPPRPNEPVTSTAAPSAVAGVVEGSVVRVSHGQTGSLAGGEEIRQGDRVLTLQDGRARIDVRNGTRIDLEGGADLLVMSEDPERVFALTTGAVRAEVAKLGARERFIIRTNDAEVEVRGTRFRVSYSASDPSCGAGTTTRVSVHEGVVMVRTHGEEWTVRGGETWPAGCGSLSLASPRTSGAVGAEPPVSYPVVPRPVLPPGGGARVPIDTLRATAAAPSGVEPTVGLAAQNDLFDRAATARRNGDGTAALAALDTLLARYPTSPLAQNAMVERMRILRGTDPGRAAVAAREYLRRFPSGFARQEAEAAVATEGTGR